MRAMVECVCQTCGRKFVVPKNWLRSGGGKHCSRTCRYNGHYNRRPIAERFWEKVDRSGGPDTCWPWIAAFDTTGYGHFGISRSEGGEEAHRMAYALTYGPIPEGMFVCHHCDNRACCNPSHLFVGTHNDNMADMVGKGHQGRYTHPEKTRRGETHGMAKLTDADVLAIREAAANGMSRKEIRERWHTPKSTIQHILTRYTWRHI